MYNSETVHGTSLGCVEQCGVSGILVHWLYGSVRCPEVGRHTAVVRCTATHSAQTGKSRSALYTRCTTPKALTAFQQIVANNQDRTSFSYTLYGSVRFPAFTRSTDVLPHIRISAYTRKDFPYAYTHMGCTYAYVTTFVRYEYAL